MGRIKTNKQYSIRLKHVELGDFYYSYTNSRKQHIFTKKLKSVAKWKTKSLVERKVNFIVRHKYDKHSIILFIRKLNKDENPIFSTNTFTKNRIIYIYVENIENRKKLEDSFNENLSLHESIKENFDVVGEFFKNELLIENYKNDFKKVFDNLVTNINKYKKNMNILSKNSKQCSVIDIINSSYNFRGVKLKMLKEE